ncbi:MAG: hypothetical protein HPAVJP_2860 [Candidatus Hepatoplasma vulgare]|nr:MAG: hypothetical protein HPAVJP_2860 [Candidatus Hepatoplasma sp.]
MTKKLKLRLQTIVSFIEKEDKVIDIGTDHLKVPIFLIENNLCLKADGSDISKKAIEKLRNNLNENLKEKIELFISDGFKNIDLSKYNTIIISGLGARKILDILNQYPLINQKLILQPTVGINLLKEEIIKLNYKMIDEKKIIEKNKKYITFLFKKI